MKYIDLHAHILPGVDDGARNMEETMEMLSAAKEQGIQEVIATPHFTGEGKVHAELVKEVMSDVRRQIELQGLDISIHSGNELLYTDGMLEALKRGKALTLADSQYILVEFLPDTEYLQIVHAVQNSILEGYQPILAHVERYTNLNTGNRLEEIKKMGAYMQMNTSSLIGSRFSTSVRRHRNMVKSGYIQFLGTDCHDAVYRKPVMADVEPVLDKICSDRQKEWMLHRNPQRVLDGKYL